MKSYPRLNALAAERVMGNPHLYDARIGMSRFNGGDSLTKEDAESLIERWKVRHPNWSEYLEQPWIEYPSSDVPNYSGDLNAAMELIEGVTKGSDPYEPYYFKLLSPVNASEGWVVDVVWCHHDGDIPCARGNGSTAPLAITLAALRAVGVSEEEIQEAMK